MNTSKGQGKALKTRKGYTMKKSTLEAIHNYLNGDETVELEALREEVNEEYNRLTAKARANANLYSEAEPIVLAALSATPMTAQEIFNACEGLPEDFTRNKVQYMLLHQLANYVVKHDNGKNANTYSLK